MKLRMTAWEQGQKFDELFSWLRTNGSMV
jgi:hypothetical protein